MTETNHETSLYNKDLAPIPQNKRTWGTWNYAALWISMSLCIPTYMLASSLIEGGMNWWQSILTIFIGNTVVLIPMILNGHAGAKYGIPFPVFARASFGTKGANIPALLRAIVACGWFGIQTWIGGFAIYQMMKLWVPSLATLPQIFPDSFGLQTGPAICFFIFWLLNMWVVYLGVESIKKLLVFKAFFLPLAALALLFWAINAGNGFGANIIAAIKIIRPCILGVLLSCINRYGWFLGNALFKYSRFYTLCKKSKSANQRTNNWLTSIHDFVCIHWRSSYFSHIYYLW